MSTSKLIESKRSPDEKPVIDTGKLERVPFFSVCIPTYNRSKFLPQAIESVLAQDFTDFELIICDNASTDNTQEVVESYKDDRIRYVRYEDLVGMYANHNRCIDLAQAEWLVFLHSDDSLDNKALSLLSNKTKELDNIDAFVMAENNLGCTQVIGKIDPIFEQKKDYRITQLSLVAFLVSDGFTPSGALFRKSQFKKLGEFEENTYSIGNKTYCYWSDTALELSWAMQNANVFISKDSWMNYSRGNQSEFQKMATHISYYKSHKIVFDQYFKSVCNEQINQLNLALKKLDINQQILFLKRCLQSNYSSEANSLEKSLNISLSKCLSYSDYKRHIIPLKISSRIYWLILDLFKKIKQA